MEFLKSAFTSTLRAIALVVAMHLPVGASAASQEIRDAAQGRAAALLKNADYAGLESLVASIKAKGYRLDDTNTELSAFYRAFSLQKGAGKDRWGKRREDLEKWAAAVPESSAARTALADWWTDYAWEARGYGWASTVTEEGWKQMSDRLDKAEEVLTSIDANKVDDPEYFRIWLTVALGQSWSFSQMNRYFEKGAAVAREYYPLYNSKGYFLLPKWRGDHDDLETFAADAADHFPDAQGDLLYAGLIQLKAQDFGDEFFDDSMADYDRVRRGFEFGMKSNDKHTRFRALSSLCHLAARKGDNETATRLFLELGPRYNPDYFGREREFVRLRNRSGAGAKIAAARALERSGSLKEAEETYGSFTGDPSTNPWLEMFYLKHGMKEKYQAITVHSDLDLDPATAHADDLCGTARIAPLVGEWKLAAEAAKRFDTMRPWNLTGRATLFLCAARGRDTAQTAALLKSFLEYKSDRPAYKTAQAVLGGTTSWKMAADDLKACDGYNQQAGLTIAACYIAQGKQALARNVLETMLARSEDSPVYYAIYESLLYGSLAPLLETSSSSRNR